MLTDLTEFEFSLILFFVVCSLKWFLFFSVLYEARKAKLNKAFSYMQLLILVAYCGGQSTLPNYS